MRYKKNVFTLLLLNGFFYFFSCTPSIQEPEFRRIGNFDIKQLGLQQNKISFNTVYFNPNCFGVTIKEAECDIFIDSVFVGKFIQPAFVEVNRQAEFSLPLEGAISLPALLQLNIKDIINREVLIKATGSVKVGKAGFFITRPIIYQGRHRLDGQ